MLAHILCFQGEKVLQNDEFTRDLQVKPDVIALQTILPVLSFTTLDSVEILNSLRQDMSHAGWHPVMLNASLQR